MQIVGGDEINQYIINCARKLQPFPDISTYALVPLYHAKLKNLEYDLNSKKLWSLELRRKDVWSKLITSIISVFIAYSIHGHNPIWNRFHIAVRQLSNKMACLSETCLKPVWNLFKKIHFKLVLINPENFSSFQKPEGTFRKTTCTMSWPYIKFAMV